MRVKDGNLGFTVIQDGEHAFEVLEEIGFTKDENNNLTNVLQIPCQVIEDEDEGGRISIFCPLDKKFGKEKLAKLIYYTGVSKKIAKKHKWVDLDDEEADDDWKDEYFEPDSEILEEMILALPETCFRGEVKTTKGKNRDFQNIISIDFYKKESKQEKTRKQKPLKEEENEDEEAW
jgi:hypothetical protein